MNNATITFRNTHRKVKAFTRKQRHRARLQRETSTRLGVRGDHALLHELEAQDIVMEQTTKGCDVG